MIDEYLKRCRELADKKCTDPKLSTVHTSPGYIKLLVYAENLKNQEAYLLTRLKEADEHNDLLTKTNIAKNIINRELKQQIPEELFDGNAVYENLGTDKHFFIKTSYVSDVLDSAVELIRERLKNG